MGAGNLYATVVAWKHAGELVPDAENIQKDNKQDNEMNIDMTDSRWKTPSSEAEARRAGDIRS